jgi:leucyl-tRNA synthetase
MTEELWGWLGKPYSIHTQPWPVVDEAAAAEEMITLAVQVNGKLRDHVTVPVGTSEDVIREAAIASDGVQKFLEGRPPKKVIVVPGKLVNVVA